HCFKEVIAQSSALALPFEELSRRECPILHSLCLFFTDTATAEIYTLSLHDALPICPQRLGGRGSRPRPRRHRYPARRLARLRSRSEEHTSELQSRENLVCRLLLEKKNNNSKTIPTAVYCLA